MIFQPWNWFLEVQDLDVPGLCGSSTCRGKDDQGACLVHSHIAMLVLHRIILDVCQFMLCMRLGFSNVDHVCFFGFGAKSWNSYSNVSYRELLYMNAVKEANEPCYDPGKKISVRNHSVLRNVHISHCYLENLQVEWCAYVAYDFFLHIIMGYNPPVLLTISHRSLWKLPQLWKSLVYPLVN